MTVSLARPASCLAAIVLAILLFVPSSKAQPLENGVFARVDGIEISGEKYRSMLKGRVRQKFYHRQVPEAEMVAFRREVGEYMVRRVLLMREAQKQGLTPDEQGINNKITQLVKRYSSKPEWERHKERFLADATRLLREDSLIEKLEARIKDIPNPSESQLQAYYAKHPDKFTTPERLGVSVILLRVPPTSPPEVWKETKGRIEGIAKQLAKGKKFEELAQLHSQDPSADEGGSLGFIHRSMLGENVQKALDTLKKGEVTKPLQLLEGYGLFRLNGREPARLNPLEKVRDRAEALWLRRTRNDFWETFNKKLRKNASIQINENYYLTSFKKPGGN